MISTIQGSLSNMKWAVVLHFLLAYRPSFCLLDQSVLTASFQTCFLQKNHEFKCWGKNTDGELGIGDTLNRGDEEDEMSTNLPYVDLGSDASAPIQIATNTDHTCSLSVDGEIKCWGAYLKWLGIDYAPRDSQGNVVQTNSKAANAVAHDLGPDFHAVKLATRNHYICALSQQGTVKCFGPRNPEFAGVIDETLPILDFGVSQPVVMLEGGRYHTCVVFSDKTSVKCWGSSLQLAALPGTDFDADEHDVPSSFGLTDFGDNFVVKQITGGHWHSCALSEDYRVKCWGSNSNAALGYGISSDDMPFLGHPNTTQWTVDLGSNFNPIQISSYMFHTCALSDQNEVKCWGQNDFGQLGYSDRKTRGDKPNQMGDNLDIINFGNNFVPIEIVAGAVHTCAVAENDRIRCWGRNLEGQLGYEDTMSRGDKKNKKKRVGKLADVAYN